MSVEAGLGVDQYVNAGVILRRKVGLFDSELIAAGRKILEAVESIAGRTSRTGLPSRLRSGCNRCVSHRAARGINNGSQERAVQNLRL